MAITAQEVNKLRQLTGAAMMDCKKALEEANGNIEEAVVILRKKGQKISEKRAGMEAKEGAVFVKTSDDGKAAVMLAINCETDFVAKNEEFLKLGEAIVTNALNNNVTDAETAKGLVIADGRTAIELITDLMGKIGEKLEITAYELLKADKIVTYIHSNAKLGVLLALDGINGADVTELGKDIAMQIAAMKPVAVDKDDVDKNIVDREVEIAKEKARNEGKPENIIEKIAMGALQTFYKENTLLNQQFVKDGSKTVGQLLKEVGKDVKVSAFKRVAIG
ncbi:MAG: elongation factor Ts [Cytophagales bacterium]|nr:MAG: elongation factor Ts [Cytophagales bacterium]